MTKKQLRAAFARADKRVDKAVANYRVALEKYDARHDTNITEFCFKCGKLEVFALPIFGGKGWAEPMGIKATNIFGKRDWSHLNKLEWAIVDAQDARADIKWELDHTAE